MFFSARSVAINVNYATAPKQCSNEQKTARVNAQVKRFVAMTVAAATYKQNNKYQPCAVTTTVASVVVKQVVKHKRLPPMINRFFFKNLFVLHYGKRQKSVTQDLVWAGI